MTVELGWRSAIAAAFIVLAIVIGVTVAIRRAQQRNVVDAERDRLIGELQEELEAAYDYAEESHEAANQYRKLRLAKEKELNRYREAIRNMRKLRKEGRPLLPTEERDTLFEANVLLEEQLKLANSEAIELRKTITFTEMALRAKSEQYHLQTKRFEACNKRHSKTKRRNIWQSVGLATAGIAIGFGMGRIAQ